MQQGIGFDDPGNPFQTSLLLMNLFFKGGGGMECSTDGKQQWSVEIPADGSGSLSPDLTTSHHQEGGAGVSPGSAHPEHTKQRWAQGSYLLPFSHFPPTEDFQNSLSLNEYHRRLSS